MSARPGSTRPATGDAGRARRRDGNIVNMATVTGTGATPDSDDASVPVAQSKVLHIEKDATVPGGTANSTGDVDQLHAGGDQHGQRGDCRCGGGRSVHDQRGAGAERRLQRRRHRPGQSAGCQRDLAVHGQPHGDAGRARRSGANIVNMATVTGTGATPDTDDASVPVAQSKSCTSRRTRRLPDGTADSTSDVINYTLAVTNTGQRGDCRCGGGRSVHDQRGAGSGRRLQHRRHRPGQSARCQRDLAVHGQPSR